jgi:hypothetical protein
MSFKETEVNWHGIKGKLKQKFAMKKDKDLMQE